MLDIYFVKWTGFCDFLGEFQQLTLSNYCGMISNIKSYSFFFKKTMCDQTEQIVHIIDYKYTYDSFSK